MFYENLFKALEKNKIRYMVGGVAMVLHGFVRATMDLDLMVAPDEANVKALMKLMTKLGYKPKVPVSAIDFSSAQKRRQWKEEKGMVVFSFFHPKKQK